MPSLLEPYRPKMLEPIYASSMSLAQTLADYEDDLGRDLDEDEIREITEAYRGCRALPDIEAFNENHDENGRFASGDGGGDGGGNESRREKEDDAREAANEKANAEFEAKFDDLDKREAAASDDARAAEDRARKSDQRAAKADLWGKQAQEKAAIKEKHQAALAKAGKK